MKLKIALIGLFAVIATALFAQDVTTGVPNEMLTSDIRDWQLNLTTLAIVAMILGRVYKAIRSGGGIRGIYRGLVYGENVPKELSSAIQTEKTSGNAGDGPGRAVLLASGLMIAGLAAGTMFSGCTTVKNATPEQVDMAASVTQLAVSQIVVPVLANNPDYENALLAVATGVDVAFAVKEVTPEGINSFLDTVALKYKLDNKTRLYIGNGLLDLLDLYKKTYQTQVATTTDPRLVTMLNAFRDGIKQGVARYHALSGT